MIFCLEVQLMLTKYFANFILLYTLFILSSCVSSKIIDTQEYQDVSISVDDLIERKVENSKILKLNPYEEGISQWKIFGWKELYGDRWKFDCYFICASEGEAGPLHSYLMLNYDISSIPKNSFISSAKLYLYLLRRKEVTRMAVLKYNEVYDEYLGYIEFRDIENYRQVFEINEADFTGGWYIADLTDVIANKISSGASHLGFYVGMSKEGLQPKTGRVAYFASAKTNYKIAPRLVIEYIEK